VSDFIEKISSYNLFNNLLPGVVFCLLADKFFSFSLIQSDIVVGLFFYYFVGLVISRVGSIIVEPLLKNIKIIEFTKYSEGKRGQSPYCLKEKGVRALIAS
jgi:hypothetical protein